jgi:hypothetical protein
VLGDRLVGLSAVNVGVIESGSELITSNGLLMTTSNLYITFCSRFDRTVLISRCSNNSTIRTVLANPGRFDKGLVLQYIAKGKKRLAAEIVPKLSCDNLLLSATSSIGTPILTPWFELFCWLLI